MALSLCNCDFAIVIDVRLYFLSALRLAVVIILSGYMVMSLKDVGYSLTDYTP